MWIAYEKDKTYNSCEQSVKMCKSTENSEKLEKPVKIVNKYCENYVKMILSTKLWKVWKACEKLTYIVNTLWKWFCQQKMWKAWKACENDVVYCSY